MKSKAIPLFVLAAANMAASSLHAQILWSSAGGSAWLTSANWTGGSVPTASQIAQFGANPTSATSGVGINFNGTTNAGTQTNGSKIQEVGAVEITSARSNNFLIGNSSTTAGATGRFRLNGTTVNSETNVILRNNSSGSLTIQNTQGTGTQTMALWLGNNTENKMVVDGSGNITISSIIASNSGTTPLTIMGGGTGRAEITNTANTFTGNININGGQARFSADGSLGAAANDIIIDGGRFSAATGFALGASRDVFVGNGTGTAIEVVSGTQSISTVIANKTGETGSFTKLGTGTLSLSGINTYTGSTTIDTGTLALTGSGSIASSPTIRMNASTSLDVTGLSGSFALGGSQTLEGTGTILATGKTVTASGTLSPGNSPGTLTQNGGTLQLGAGGDLNWQILDAVGSAGAGFDTVSLINGATLDLSLLSSVSPYNINLWSLSSITPDTNGNALNFDETSDYSWTLFSTGSAISGFDASHFTINTAAFNGTNGFSNSFTGSFGVSLADGGSDLVLTYTAIPEPGAALIGGLGLLALLRRRRD